MGSLVSGSYTTLSPVAGMDSGKTFLPIFELVSASMITFVKMDYMRSKPFLGFKDQAAS
jgi:hypothetical protein